MSALCQKAKSGSSGLLSVPLPFLRRWYLFRPHDRLHHAVRICLSAPPLEQRVVIFVRASDADELPALVTGVVEE